MAEDFFARAPERFRQYNITPDQIATLKACIYGEVSLTEAAARLTERVSAAPIPVEMQQRLAGLWELLNTAAVKIPSQQPVIISILRIIRTFPPVQEPVGVGVEEGEGMDLDDGDIWNNLTEWVVAWADDWNHYGANYKLESIRFREPEMVKADWISANAYTARLAATEDEVLSASGGHLRRAFQSIVTALEVDTGDKEPEDLEAAAQLFKYAAPQVYRLCREAKEVDRYHPLWHGRVNKNPIREPFDGPSVERWEFWKERWEVLAGMPMFTEDGRRAAVEALEAMNCAED